MALHDADAEDEPNGSLMIRYALAGDVARLGRCFIKQYAKQPRELFDGFDAKLREVANERAG